MYDLCLGASTFTPFAVGCSVLKKTDLIFSCPYVKFSMDFNKYNSRIPWKSVIHKQIVVIGEAISYLKQL